MARHKPVGTRVPYSMRGPQAIKPGQRGDTKPRERFKYWCSKINNDLIETTVNFSLLFHLGLDTVR